MEFGEQELKDIIISALALSVLFSFKNFLSNNFLIILLFNIIIVGFALFFKIFIQKKVAKKFDCSAVFKFNYNLFIISLLLAFITNGFLIFAAIGSTLITSSLYTRLGHKFVNITQRMSGLISLSGSMANVILALASTIFYSLSPDFFQNFFNVNILFAVFNMIPLPPLDGAKVLWWSRLVWLAYFIIPLFLLFFGFSTIFSITSIILLIIITFILWQKMF